ncbi:hypothetical protein ACVWXL_001339 [Bradyrhizobium sp. GM22.5]
MVGLPFHTGEAFVDEGAHRLFPMPAVRGVDRELLAGLGDLHGATRETEATGFAVKREDVDALAKRQHQRSLRAVGDEPRRELRRAALMEGEREIVGRGQDREDRAHGHVDVDIGGAVERIDRDADLRRAVTDLRFTHLLRRQCRDRQLAETAAQDRIRPHVEIALHVTVAVAAGGQARRIRKVSRGDKIGDLDRGRRDGIDRGRYGQRMRRRLGIPLKVVVQPELPGHLRPSLCRRRIQFPPRWRSARSVPTTRRLTGAA